MKINVLSVCYGNICRSPMAELVFKDLVRKKGLADKFYIDSAATSSEAVGEGIYYGTVEVLKENKVPIEKHISRQITKQDYEKFDYILAMEEKNINGIKAITGKDEQNKIYKLLDFSCKPRDIIDPWYYGNFDNTYWDVVEGCEDFLKMLLNKHIL